MNLAAAVNHPALPACPVRGRNHLFATGAGETACDVVLSTSEHLQPLAVLSGAPPLVPQGRGAGEKTAGGPGLEV